MTKMEYSSIEHHFKRYPRLTLPCHKQNVHSVKWNHDGTMIASGGKDKILHLHRMVETELIQEQRYSNNGHTQDIDHVCWDPLHTNILATASLDRTVKIWDARYNDPIFTVKLKSENISLCWKDTGSTIAVADKADFVTFIDSRGGYKVVKEQKFQFEIGDVSWNKENDLFFVTSGDGKIHILSYPDLQSQLTIDAFASPIPCIRFDPTGKHFAVGSNDSVTAIWDTENFICSQTVDRLEWPVKAISFSHDGRYVASGSEDQFIDIASTQTGQQEAAIEVSSPTVTLDFHPKDYILAYALEEREYRDVGTIKIVGLPEERRRAYS